MSEFNAMKGVGYVHKYGTRFGLIAFGIISALLLGGCGEKAAPADDIPVVKTARVIARADAGASVYAGEVRGRYESQLAFQVGGRISARRVALGSKVRAGDVLFEIDAKDVRESANIGAAQLESARAQLSLAEANLKRYKALYEEDAVSAAMYDQYRINYNVAEASYKQAEAQFAQGSNALHYAKLTANSDGVISSVQAEIGQVVAAGQSVVTLVKSGELEVEINVPEHRLADMREGAPVTVSFWALRDLSVDGTVREVSPMAEAVGRTYKVRIQLIDPPPELQLGMTASVTGAESGGPQAIFVPLPAIYQTDGQPQVWVVEEGVVHLRAVTVEAFGDNQVKVTSGLADGETIVVAGVHKLREGQSVRLAAGDAE